MLTNIRYVLLCALQDRLFYGLVALLIAIVGLSAVLGNTAFLEQQEMTIVFTAAATRLMLIIATTVFVCFHIQSSFENKHMDVMLSRPISRPQVVISYWLGFAFVTFLMMIPVYLSLLLLSAAHITGLLYWAFTMMLELWLVVAFALFASLIVRSAVISVLATLAFYVLSRMMILFLMTAEHSSSRDLMFVKPVMEWLAVFVPRLDMFAKTEWLVYGDIAEQSTRLIATQSSVFIILLLIICIIDFRKKQF